MKKVIVMCFIVVVIIIPAFLFINSCASGVSCPLNPEPDNYYIKFTMNGPGYTLDINEITMNYGPAFSVPDPLAVLVSDSEIQIKGGTCGEGGEQVDITMSLNGFLSPNTPGEYIGTYGDEVTDIGTCNIAFEIGEGESGPYFYDGTDETITITSFEGLESDVEGTFSCTLEYNNAIAPSLGSPLSVTGEFRLKNIRNYSALKRI